MVKLLRCPIHWLVICYLVVLASTLSGCEDANTSSSNNGSQQKTSVMTVTVKEMPSTTCQDAYTFDKTSITIKKGETITFRNLTDEVQEINQGDAQKAGVNAKVPMHGFATATFSNPGTFTIQSNHGAVMTVSVN